MIKELKDELLNRINDMLPSEEPETEAERLYEEGKKKVYALHNEETDIFYVDNVWVEDEKIHIYGEFARGDFSVGQDVEFLDNYAGHLLFGRVAEILDERPQSVKVKRGFFKTEPKIYLILTCEDLALAEETMVYTNFLIKRKK